MRMHVIDDDKAQSEFGYQEIKQYHIFVKKSVYKQFLKKELKEPLNWLKFSWQIVQLIARFIGRTFVNAFFLTIALFMGYLVLNGANDRAVLSPEMAVTHNNLATFIALFIQIFGVVCIIGILVNGLKNSKNEVFNNIFTEKMFNHFHQQALLLDMERTAKKEEAKEE